MTDIVQVALTLGGGILTATLGYIYNLRLKDKQEMKDKFKEYDGEIEMFRDRATKLEARLVTENRVREIVREELAPISADIHEMKNSVQSVLSLVQKLEISMAEERGFRRALDKVNKE